MSRRCRFSCWPQAACRSRSCRSNALSRAHERRADRYALDMTKNVPAFVSAMKRLGAQNLAEEHPSRLVQILFYTHPPISARIEAAHAWANNQYTAAVSPDSM